MSPVDEAWEVAAGRQRRIEKLEEVLRDIRDLYCDGRADADCVGDPPRYVPNAWMQVQTIIEEALR